MTVMTNDPDARELSPDWKAFISSHTGLQKNEILLDALVEGDQILVKTRNTQYLFTWKTADLAELRTSSSRAPSGPVRIMGCGFGLSSSIRPDALFCGGNLEFTHANGERRWTTSAIEEIHFLHTSAKKETAP